MELTIDDEIFYEKKGFFQQHYFLLVHIHFQLLKKKHFQKNPSSIFEKFCIQHFNHNIHK